MLKTFPLNITQQSSGLLCFFTSDGVIRPGTPPIPDMSLPELHNRDQSASVCPAFSGTFCLFILCGLNCCFASKKKKFQTMRIRRLLLFKRESGLGSGRGRELISTRLDSAFRTLGLCDYYNLNVQFTISKNYPKGR